MTYNQKAAIRSLTGKQNRTKGKVFEEYIETACAVYKDKHIAKIEKTPEPMKIIRSIGDTVYLTDNAGDIYESEVTQVVYNTKGIAFDERAIGKTVFTSREAAEKAVKEQQ